MSVKEIFTSQTGPMDLLTGSGITLPPDISAVVFFYSGGVNFLMQLQFLAPVGGIIIIYDFQFCSCAVSHVYTFIKTDKFNHFGRSDAWNSTHHGRYVFKTAFFS